MDHKEYIESGIIELYVLGALSPAEAAEVEAMADLYPEIRLEIDAVRTALEQNFLEHPVTPPSHVKSNIMQAIQNEAQIQEEPAPAIEMPTQRTRNMNFYAYAASALLIVSLGLNFYFFNSNQVLKKEFGQLKWSNDSLAKDYIYLRDSYYALEGKLDMMFQPSQKMIKMTSVKQTESMAMIMWDAKTRKVRVAMDHLEKLPQGKQYQLWAIVDGKPVDLGVFDEMKKFEVKEMKSVENASAFAVTIENAGGVPSPTMEAMVVMGAV